MNADRSDYPNKPERPSIPDSIYAIIAEATGSSDTEALIWITNI